MSIISATKIIRPAITLPSIVKVTLSLCLIKHYAIKTYGGWW